MTFRAETSKMNLDIYIYAHLFMLV